MFVRAQALNDEPSPFDLFQGEENASTGSGFVIDEEGHVLTNAHVVNLATDVQVTFSDERTVPAQVVGKDEDTDLARAEGRARTG